MAVYTVAQARKRLDEAATLRAERDRLQEREQHLEAALQAMRNCQHQRVVGCDHCVDLADAALTPSPEETTNG